ncbi:hypothetical protein [Streptomyces sp. KR55]|uniref:hypothetical protein n=1 Tax=Streptomyces sp. KR55 TaxID=3457425 RepID=UPI003FD5AA39
MSAGFEWFGDGASINPVQINGYRSLLRRNGEIGTVVAVRIDDGLVTELYSVRNPEELSSVKPEAP